TLRRNESLPQLPRFPTEVKLLHDNHTLAVLARCIEPDRVLARAKERDGPVDEDDSFQVYLATSGSGYVEYAINPTGYILDGAGHSGNPRVSRPHYNWDSAVEGMARERQREWLARLDLPLQTISEVLGEFRPPREWRILLLRSRPGRDGEPREISVLPVTESVTPFCPARYRRLVLVQASLGPMRGAPIRDNT